GPLGEALGGVGGEAAPESGCGARRDRKRADQADPGPARAASPRDDEPLGSEDDAEPAQDGDEPEPPESTLTGTAADLRRRKPPDERDAVRNEGLKGFRDVVAEAESLGHATVQPGKPARAAFAAVRSPSPEFDRLEPRMEPEGLRSRDRRVPPVPARDREPPREAPPRRDAPPPRGPFPRES